MSLRHNSPIRRTVLLIMVVSLACKFLIPVGYMPTAIGDGWPVRMCHTGLPASLIAQDNSHHQHSQSDDLHWEQCSFGVLYSADAVASDHALQELNFNDVSIPATSARHSIATLVFAFRSRAPPTRIL